MEKPVAQQNIDLGAALSDAINRYAAANPKSAARHRDAARVLPGGNTRAVLWYEPFPLTMVRGEGCRLTDLDGHDYIDLVCEYTAGLYGHSDPTIREAIATALSDGIVLGAPNRYEARLAELMVARFPALERVRFCNSGTEANIMALSLARAITGRSKVLVFDGAYHGGVLTFSHGGSPLNLPFPFETAEFNDAEGAAARIDALSGDLAAVIVEPMMGGGGCIAAAPPFLAALRDRTAAASALLIFDEVMTSRLAPGGRHSVTGVTPDLVTFGKYLGGGASFGAFGGRADLMDRMDPASPNAFSHGGTFNNNVLSMAAGVAGLSEVFTPEACLKLNATGDRLRTGLQDILDRFEIAATVTGLGSIMNLHFTPGPIASPAAVAGQDRRLLQLWQFGMMTRGIYATPRGMLALSLPFGESELGTVLGAAEDFVSDQRSVLPRLAP